MATLTFLVDDRDLIADFARVVGALDGLVDKVAKDLADEVKSEAGRRSTRLGEPWEITGEGPEERHVVAPEFFAHFLSGGTASHGPLDAPRLVFSVDGQTVGAKFVRGIEGDPFDERAMQAVESRLDVIVAQAVREVS